MSFRSIVEVTYPEYRERHIFTAKLRLALFLLFWFLYVIFLKDWMEETRVIAITISCCFLATTLCYYNIFRGKLVFVSFIGEVVSDIISLTAIVYLTGGPNSTYFTVYIFYVIAAGMLYNHIIAGIVATISLICYLLFLIISYSGIIPPMFIAMEGTISPSVRSPYFHPLVLTLFLFMAVYTTKIAHYFTQMRERILEARNKELTALHKMSNAIRSMISLEAVLNEVLQGVLHGLEFELTLLMLFDRSTKTIRCYPPKNNEIVNRIEEALSFPLERVIIPLEAVENTALRSLRQNQVIFRRDFGELVVGLNPAIDPKIATKIQREFGLQKVVGVPLVAEGEIMGALFGFTAQPFVGEKMVQTLESFANQAALAIQTAQLIAELKKKNIALQEANRVKSEFLATMSHELRTPLTAIIGFSELLMEGVMGELNDEQRESVHEVLNNGSNLLDMINNLLDLAKVDSGKMKLNTTSFDLAELLERVRHTIASLIHKKQHNLMFDISREMPPIIADEKRIQQIVLNLLSNAIKFTPEGGDISIFGRYFTSISEMSKTVKNISITKDVEKKFKDGVFYVSVYDSGIGIKQEHLQTIFDMFSQVDSSVTRSYEGTGLGLALAKQFVELHGGLIWAESEFGHGARFSFVLPYERFL